MHAGSLVLRHPRIRRGGIVVAAAALLSACSFVRPAPAPREPLPLPPAHSVEVTATAYNSIPDQTEGDGTLTAFGLRLRPGMHIVAVSRDLEAEGLHEGVRITIDGLEGEWQVGDRLSERWRERIDIFMGSDVAAALAWGKRRVRIRWTE
jgi:3D (Asp-Asp-Asp) domain-containing protein